MRLLRGSIQEELQPLSNLETALECAQVFYDIVQCHHWVYTYPQILHRDISDGNIMIRVKDGKKYGVLNDWDLAIWLNNRDGISTSQFRTGTRPYMAHEQHSPSWRGPHRYRHDLESLFYVILLLATLFSSPSERAYKSLDVDEDHDDDEDDDDEDDDNGKDDKPSETSYHYQTWFTQGDDFIYKDKALIILDLSWQPIPTQFFRDFFHWLMRLQHSLNAGFVALKGHIVRQRDTPRQIPHFDNDTLNSHFSYDCLVSIMHQFSEEKLETHGREWQEKLREFQKNEDERKA
ncbi:protein kinase [Lentinula edodes]|uniref:Protein kinase n=1 Tax=Lentinula edodes TaxID=5353 RepID=A0A1Q3ES20_LENED|nr:protein kinase [Lentinula edodes]